MANFFNIILNFINNFHDVALRFVNIEKYPSADKWLHFIVIGVAGLILFACVNAAFKRIAKYSIPALSFIYTLTAVISVSIVIELEQGLTGRGKVELMDIVAGLCGFVFSFGAVWVVKMICKRIKEKESDGEVGEKGNGES